MFRNLSDFRTAHDRLTEGTRKILAALTDDSLSQAVAEGHRTLGGMAWHIVTSVPEIMQRTGLPLSELDPESPPPASVEELRSGYEAVTDELRRAISEAWSDADLERTDDMYGQSWPRGLSLTVLIDHEIHHRGQMTVLMRQAGLVVPGVFGPAQQDWAAIGKSPPPY